MYAIIVVNVLCATVTSAIQSIISSATDEKSQGTTLGAIGGVNSLMAVLGPPIGATLLALVSDLPEGDWRIGAPLYFCAMLQGTALVLAVLHFRREGQLRR